MSELSTTPKRTEQKSEKGQMSMQHFLSFFKSNVSQSSTSFEQQEVDDYYKRFEDRSLGDTSGNRKRMAFDIF